MARNKNHNVIINIKTKESLSKVCKNIQREGPFYAKFKRKFSLKLQVTKLNDLLIPKLTPKILGAEMTNLDLPVSIAKSVLDSKAHKYHKSFIMIT